MFKPLPLPKPGRTRGRTSCPVQMMIGKRKPSATTAKRKDISIQNVPSSKKMKLVTMMMKNPALPLSQRNPVPARRARRSPPNESTLLKVILWKMILMMTDQSTMIFVISRG